MPNDSAANNTTEYSDDELRERLTPLQYHVTQEAGSERAFTGETWDNKADGTYRCIVCDEELFSSNTKYECGSGWPRSSVRPPEKSGVSRSTEASSRTPDTSGSSSRRA